MHGLRVGRVPRSHVPVALQRPAASRWPLAAVVHLLSRLNGSGEARVRAHVVPRTRSLNECCYSPPAAYCWLHTLPNRWLQCWLGGQESHPPGITHICFSLAQLQRSLVAPETHKTLMTAPGSLELKAVKEKYSRWFLINIHILTLLQKRDYTCHTGLI